MLNGNDLYVYIQIVNWVGSALLRFIPLYTCSQNSPLWSSTNPCHSYMFGAFSFEGKIVTSANFSLISLIPCITVQYVVSPWQHMPIAFTSALVACITGRICQNFLMSIVWLCFENIFLNLLEFVIARVF